MKSAKSAGPGSMSSWRYPKAMVPGDTSVLFIVSARHSRPDWTILVEEFIEIVSASERHRTEGFWRLLSVMDDEIIDEMNKYDGQGKLPELPPAAKRELAESKALAGDDVNLFISKVKIYPKKWWYIWGGKKNLIALIVDCEEA
jgi:hypothetical protein